MSNDSLIASPATLKAAAKHLQTGDAILAPVVAAHGLATLQPHRNYYQELVDSIISQQLSVQAARAIEGRFRDLFGGSFPTATEIMNSDVETLRSIGFSRAKASYVLDLAQHVIDQKVRFDHLDSLSNQQIVDELTAVKGIGEWTVHMFLMFCMGRLDVLAYGDLGVRNGIKKLYGLDEVPNKETIIDLAQRNGWHPYESAACWYVWQSLGNAPAVVT